MTAKSSDYAAHLRHQTAVIRAFGKILVHERDVLAGRPVAHEALSAVTEEKARCAAELDRLEQQRRQLVKTLVESKASDDQTLAEALGCASEWTDLRVEAARAQAQNAINGAAIRVQHAHVDTRLHFLRGKVSPALYAADGRRQGQASAGRFHGGV